ncbi:hypothetical protein GCM10022397_30610 [Flavivirga jejuensis]
MLSVSCSKDDNPETNMNPIGDLLDPNMVSENVIIVGSDYIKDKLPTPNGNISLELLKQNQFALPVEGFDISLETEEPIIGAYIQFEHNDGSLASGYFDVNIRENLLGKTSRSNTKNEVTLNKKYTLDIDFNENISSAIFCYTISVYDAEQNISAPQRVCVEVGVLGGNAELAKTWSFASRQNFYISDMGGTETFKIGDTLIKYYSSFDCDTGERITLSGVSIQDKNTLTLNIDGTYGYKNDRIDDKFDRSASSETCEQVSGKVVKTHENRGVWSYQATTKRLVLIEHRRTLKEDGTVTSDSERESGDGDLFWDVLVELNTNELKLFDGDGVSRDSVWWTYFTQ